MNSALLRQCGLVFILSTLIKLLTISTVLYKSTDFEVHRNWLAITYSLPFREWYTEARNIWTLDYPPFFAYFEYTLSMIGQFFDPHMLSVDNINYSSFSTILFQRLSVILISDGILALCIIHTFSSNHQNTIKGLILTLFSSTLFIVDHVHFQYNGMMLGLLILSTTLIENGRFLIGASLYMFLVFFKHIYLYSAPVYFVFCLGRYVVEKKEGVKTLVRLASVVVLITLIALVPLIVTDQLGPALSRMFPFGRGLVHSYWAPNFWALYLFADRVLAKLVGGGGDAGATRGLVQVTDNAFLPNVTPSVTFALTFGVYLVFLTIVWSAARRVRNIPLLVLVGYGNAICFFFGWHIHEKAVLMITFPLLIQSVSDKKLRSYNWMLGFVSCMTLLPLLPRPQETVLKWFGVATGGLLDFIILRPDDTSHREIFGVMAVAIIPEVFRVFIHGIVMKDSKYEFLPLMMASVTGAILLGSILCYAMSDMMKRPTKTK